MLRADDVQAFVRRRPFEPFRVSLTDGRTYDVRHPEFAMVGRTTVAIGIPRPLDLDRRRLVYDRLVTVDLLHIKQIEPIETEAA